MQTASSSLRPHLVARFGVAPNFFGDPDSDANELGRSLWLRAQQAYLDAPFPAHFKERLFTYLSLFCPAEYCLLRHAAFLRGSGHVAGDPTADPLSSAELLQLLNTIPPRGGSEASEDLESLVRSPPVEQWPSAGSPTERLLFRNSVRLYLDSDNRRDLARALKRTTGNWWTPLTALLEFISDAHKVTQSRSVPLDADVVELFTTDLQLAGWLAAYRSFCRRWNRPPAAPTEVERLLAVRECLVLDTRSETVLDELVRAASRICDTPIALVTLVDEHRQLIRAGVGWDEKETARAAAFCNYTIKTSDVLEVPNTLNDERFRSNPLVTGPRQIRFYAGIPLVLPTGEAVGGLCVLDRQPRRLGLCQRETLQHLARSVVELLAMARALARMRSDGGLLTACAWCRSVRIGDETSNEWVSTEEYLGRVFQMSHGMCERCLNEF